MLLATYLDYVDNSGHYVITDENGFLRNPSDWSREFTITKAREIDITLTDRHWQLIDLQGRRFRETRAQDPDWQLSRIVENSRIA